MAHILIGFAEALPAPEVLFSLLDAGHRVSAFARSTHLPLARLPLEKLHLLPAPERDVSAAIAALRAVMAAPGRPDLILPLDDGGLWLTNAALGESPGSAGATGEQGRVALDKIVQITAAAAAGLAVPPTVIVRSPTDLPDDIPLPAIAKPALAIRVCDGSLGKGEVIYLPDHTAVAELRAGLSEDMEPLLVQPLLAGEGEGVFGFATPEGIIGWSGHRRLRMMNPHGSGSSACISTVPSAQLRGDVEAFIAAIGWQGPFMVELLRGTDGTVWFMELNGRMWGSMALARRQGLEYPAWAVARALNPDFRPNPPLLSERPVVQRNLGREILHLLFVLRGPRSAFHKANWPRFCSSLAAVLKPSHPRQFYNYNNKYRSFFIYEALWTIRKAISR